MQCKACSDLLDSVFSVVISVSTKGGKLVVRKARDVSKLRMRRDLFLSTSRDLVSSRQNTTGDGTVLVSLCLFSLVVKVIIVTSGLVMA